MVMVVLVVLMVLMVMVLLHTPECHLTDRWLGDEYCVVRTEKTHSPLSLSLRSHHYNYNTICDFFSRPCITQNDYSVYVVTFDVQCFRNDV